jgi:hypothetical protein
MPIKVAAALVALFACALMVPDRIAFARDCAASGFEKAVSPPSKAAIKGWIHLHRPDGETVRIKSIQIVFVTTATGTGAAKRAQSKLQLLNGFVDVRETIEEVMQIIQMDELPEQYGT